MGARSRSCPDQQSKLVVYPPFRFLKPCHRGRTAGLELDCCACKSGRMCMHLLVMVVVDRRHPVVHHRARAHGDRPCHERRSVREREGGEGECQHWIPRLDTTDRIG